MIHGFRSATPVAMDISPAMKSVGKKLLRELRASVVHLFLSNFNTETRSSRSSHGENRLIRQTLRGLHSLAPSTSTPATTCPAFLESRPNQSCHETMARGASASYSNQC